jgi:hypothetical protein
MTGMPRVDFDELDLGDNQLITWKGQPFTRVAIEFSPNGKSCSEAPHLEGVGLQLYRKKWGQSAPPIQHE